MGVFFSSIIFLTARLSWAQSPVSANFFDDPSSLIFVVAALTLIPIIAILTTSFAKIVVVLSIARQALGTPQAPPNIVIISLAIILTCFGMYPVFTQIYTNLDTQIIQSSQSKNIIIHILDTAKDPIKSFLTKKAQPENIDLFFEIIQDQNNIQPITRSDFIILAPAFLISELTQAFQIGFLIYLPFLVIDMTIANLLMALGMQMLAPTTISLPFKILLFVLVDGWRMLAQGLVG